MLTETASLALFSFNREKDWYFYCACLFPHHIELLRHSVSQSFWYGDAQFQLYLIW